MDANPRMCELIGYGKEQLFLKTIPEIINEDASLLKERLELINRGEAVRFEVPLRGSWPLG